MINTYRLLSFYLLLVSVACLAQEDLTELDKRNGFKDIKLGMHIDSLVGAKFKKDIHEKGNHDAKLYEVLNPENSSIGEVAVNKIEVKAYKNLVYEIYVWTVKDGRLMKGMEAALGKPIYDVRDDTYTWVGKNLTLKFKSARKNQLELAYYSKLIRQLMEDDKKKKIQDISEDF